MWSTGAPELSVRYASESYPKRLHIRYVAVSSALDRPLHRGAASTDSSTTSAFKLHLRGLNWLDKSSILPPEYYIYGHSEWVNNWNWELSREVSNIQRLKRVSHACCERRIRIQMHQMYQLLHLISELTQDRTRVDLWSFKKTRTLFVRLLLVKCLLQGHKGHQVWDLHPRLRFQNKIVPERQKFSIFAPQVCSYQPDSPVTLASLQVSWIEESPSWFIPAFRLRFLNPLLSIWSGRCSWPCEQRGACCWTRSSSWTGVSGCISTLKWWVTRALLQNQTRLRHKVKSIVRRKTLTSWCNQMRQRCQQASLLKMKERPKTSEPPLNL